MNILLIAKNEYKNLLKEYKITKCEDYTKIKEYMHQEFDAIIIDSNIDYNVLSILYEYDNPFNLSKTIILDNNYACYSMLNEGYQLYAILNKSHIKYIDYYLEKIKERNVLYNYNKANLYDEIAQMLKRLGISPDKDGFHYLRKAIYEIFNDSKLKNNYAKIYDMLENTFSTNKKDIERSIRYSISVGFRKSDYEYSERLFSNILSYEQTQPKNSEFIAIVVEELQKIHHKTRY